MSSLQAIQNTSGLSDKIRKSYQTTHMTLLQRLESQVYIMTFINKHAHAKIETYSHMYVYKSVHEY